MGKIVYSGNVSLDGYIEDADGEGDGGASESATEPEAGDLGIRGTRLG